VRYVIEKISDEEQSKLKHAIQRSRLDVILHSLEGLDMHPSISHKILHMVALEAFKGFRVEWASGYVRDQVIAQACSRESLAVRIFVKSAGGINEVASLRGNLFEPLCHQLVAKGGQFLVRKLSSGTEGVPLRMTPCVERRFFTDWKTVSESGEGVYLRPASKSFAAVDAIKQPDILLQMTVAHDHPINAKGLCDAVQALKSDKVKLMFVVPDDQFERYRTQRIEYAKASSPLEKGKQAKIISRVQQFAIQVRL
jgi:hypothetical protein